MRRYTAGILIGIENVFVFRRNTKLTGVQKLGKRWT
jgi:hypothetical protein